jgi:hypothetical protein
MTFMHTPGVGVVWDSVNDSRCLGAVFYYPLKTSRCCIQFSCCSPCFLMASFHVALTSLCSVGSRFIWVTVILSSVTTVSLSLILRVHLAMISGVE